MEAYRRYTPLHPTSEGQWASVIMAFIRQSAPDIRKKLQWIEGLQDYTIRDLVREAEKVYHKRETEEEKQEREKNEKKEDEDRREKKQEETLARMLATVVDRDKKDRIRQQGDLRGEKWQEPRRPRRGRQHIENDQCAFCKAKVYWALYCPKKGREKKVLTLEDNTD